MRLLKQVYYHSVWITLTLFIIVFDQATKWMALQYLLPYHPRHIFPGLNFTLAFNHGAAFSFLSNAGGWQVWFFLSLSIVVSVVLVYLLIVGSKRNLNALKFMSFILILSGALGNFIDRASYGYVVDFIDVYINSYHWPIFNVADSAITLGACLLLLDNYKQPKKTLSSNVSSKS